MNGAWLVRNTVYGYDANLTKEFLDKGFIAFGPGGFGNLSGKSSKELKEIFAKSIFGDNKEQANFMAADCNRFVNVMKEMDLAMLVDETDVYLLEVMTPYYFDENNDMCNISYPHRRKIRMMRRVSREDLSSDLRIALKSGRKISNLDKYYEEIYKLTYGKELPKKDKPAGKPVKVTYPLRPNYEISFEIPSNMTRSEARRLAKFLETLYYEEK